MFRGDAIIACTVRPCDCVRTMRFGQGVFVPVGDVVSRHVLLERVDDLAHERLQFRRRGAFVLRQRDEIRKFNYHGDLQTITGEVTDRRVDDGQPVVDVRVAAVSQRGEETAFAEATIALPSREHGPVVLPTVPAELQREAADFLRAHRRAVG